MLRSQAEYDAMRIELQLRHLSQQIERVLSDRERVLERSGAEAIATAHGKQAETVTQAVALCEQIQTLIS
jgi:ubiquinone/menaquinone biosynthesis C-methylase UbiE